MYDKPFLKWAGGKYRLLEAILWELPAGEYVVCQFEAESFAELRTAAIDKALKYLLETWLVGHRLPIRPFSAEKYTGITADASSMEIWVQLL